MTYHTIGEILDATDIVYNAHRCRWNESQEYNPYNPNTPDIEYAYYVVSYYHGVLAYRWSCEKNTDEYARLFITGLDGWLVMSFAIKGIAAHWARMTKSDYVVRLKYSVSDHVPF